ncbi:MAG TPA: cytochrome C oxidase subunit IV family protein [Thermoanaerobaculia bacterium]|nr:cytochrome C oxidase subunit IV family protein [Thermoanaerobaculia bacterium]
MSSHDDADSIKKQTGAYIKVFVALMVLTVVTVGVAYIHMPVALAVGVALVIALFKGTLVAGVFMHLFDERKLIYWVLALTVLFFLVLLFYPTLSEWDQRKL